MIAHVPLSGKVRGMLGSDQCGHIHVLQMAQDLQNFLPLLGRERMKGPGS